MQISTEEVANAPQSPPASPEFDIPDPSWGHEKLGMYVRERLNEGKRLEDEAIKLGRRSAEEIYYAGMALAIVKDQMKSKGKWMYWQELHGFAVQTVNETIRLYERIMDPAKLRGMTITEAKIEAGIIKRRKPKDKATAPETKVGGDGDKMADAAQGEKASTAEPVPPSATTKGPEGTRAAGDPSRIVEEMIAELKQLGLIAEALVNTLGTDFDPDVIDPDVMVHVLDDVLKQMRGVTGQLREAKKACQAKVSDKKPKGKRRKTAVE
jgi:hypothetical protein